MSNANTSHSNVTASDPTLRRRLHRLLVITIAALAALVSVSAPAVAVTPNQTASVQHGTAVVAAAQAAPVRTAAANCSPGISASDCNAAAAVYKFAVSHNYSPPAGFSGGAVYRNSTGLLPAGGNYREYDIYKVKPRAAERLVIDVDNPEGNSWFSPDHYSSFAQFYLLA